jgi:CheY-like chemotaxis protein
MREFYRQREPQLTLTPVHLNGLAQQALDLTRVRWSDEPQQRGAVIQVKVQLADELPPIMGVESEIREALINLIFNSVDAMPDGGTLTLRTVAEKSAPELGESPGVRRVCLELTDTGVGMDDETRRRCLEPFFTTKGERGTGLGLAMVYGTIKRHSAGIEIESAPGQGTTVRLIFSVSTVVSTAASQPSKPNVAPVRLHILLIDDDPILIKSMRDTLETDGHTVVTASGGQEGIHAFGHAQESGAPFGVVITDLGMPYVDGRKVASAVKASSPCTPVILLTGWGQRLEAEGDIPPCVDRLLSKPPKLRDLREALADCRPTAI